MSDEQLAPVTLSRDQWRIVQEALDAYCHEVEHSKAGGVRPAVRTRNEARRAELLETLPLLDIAIAEQTGSGPVFGK